MTAQYAAEGGVLGKVGIEFESPGNGVPTKRRFRASWGGADDTSNHTDSVAVRPP